MFCIFVLSKLGDDNPGLSELMAFIKKLRGVGLDHPIDAEADVKFKDFLPIHLDHKYVFYNVRQKGTLCPVLLNTSVLGKLYHPAMFTSCVLDNIQHYGEYISCPAGYSEDT